MSRKSKRTPLEQYWSAEALTKLETDWHNLVRAQTDPCLPFDQRLELLKSLQAWPRIVLGLYQAEHKIAKSKFHNDSPSRIAAPGRPLPHGTLPGSVFSGSFFNLSTPQ